MNETEFELLNFDVFPNPGMGLLAIQANGLVKKALKVQLLSSTGDLVMETSIFAGQTIAYFDLQTLHQGVYFVNVSNGDSKKIFQVIHN